MDLTDSLFMSMNQSLLRVGWYAKNFGLLCFVGFVIVVVIVIGFVFLFREYRRLNKKIMEAEEEIIKEEKDNE